MKKRFWGLLILAVMAAGWSISCNPSIFDQPEETGDGWPTASLKSVGMDEDVLSEMMECIEDGIYENNELR